MNGGLIATVMRAFCRVMLPLVAYYAVTVAIPLANGAARAGATFWQHTLAVLVVPPAIVVALSVGRALSGLPREADKPRATGSRLH